MKFWATTAISVSLSILSSGSIANDLNGEAQQSAPPTSEDGVSASAFAQKVDSIFEEYDRANTPGCAVGVVHDGEFVHAKGYGQANLEHGVPIDRYSVFRVASISKQFTALAIAILAERGELDLDADVHAYLPELEDYGSPVTIRQMVHHVSGMGGYNDDFEIADGKSFRFGNEDYWTIEEFYAEVAKQPLVAEPGEKFQYSNLAYFLLSQVVERVSGQSLRDFAQAEIFDPLDMGATFFNDNVLGIVPGRADGYRPLEDGRFEIMMTNLNWVGDGGVYTSLDDFIKWDRALSSGNIPGGEGVLELMTTPDPLTFDASSDESEDKRIGYGFGLFVGAVEGRKRIYHGGAWVGFRASYVQFPDDNVSILRLCNRSDVPRDTTDRLIDAALDEYGN